MKIADLPLNIRKKLPPDINLEADIDAPIFTSPNPNLKYTILGLAIAAYDTAAAGMGTKPIFSEAEILYLLRHCNHNKGYLDLKTGKMFGCTRLIFNAGPPYLVHAAHYILQKIGSIFPDKPPSLDEVAKHDPTYYADYIDFLASARFPWAWPTTILHLFATENQSIEVVTSSMEKDILDHCDTAPRAAGARPRSKNPLLDLVLRYAFQQIRNEGDKDARKARLNEALTAAAKASSVSMRADDLAGLISDYASPHKFSDLSPLFNFSDKFWGIVENYARNLPELLPPEIGLVNNSLLNAMIQRQEELLNLRQLRAELGLNPSPAAAIAQGAAAAAAAVVPASETISPQNAMLAKEMDEQIQALEASLNDLTARIIRMAKITAISTSPSLKVEDSAAATDTHTTRTPNMTPHYQSTVDAAGTAARTNTSSARADGGAPPDAVEPPKKAR